ncbi:glycosyltransferase [Micromonospora sp. NPDC050686]|uniref:glycosyltransferase n=1 Tax=Micromonospora sp. NPDC050686 TaxID=3154631 RepID=UPI0033E5F0FE
MRLALVCGDGLAVSGLLTIFRNVVEAELQNDQLELPIIADLGFSWRPDKKHFFPDGGESVSYPHWMIVNNAVPLTEARSDVARELTEIRRAVARADSLDHAECQSLTQLIEKIAAPYEKYFTDWFEKHEVDWVCAVNMTLSDAVPVTLALHRAAAKRWGPTRPGGVLFWDHDLFGSYAVIEEGVRVYPPQPNRFTPLPGSHSCHLWAVVSQGLADEAGEYPTPLKARVTPNVLPAVKVGPLEVRHEEFAARHSLEPGRPLLLVPVRVFRVKGVEIAVSLFARIREICVARNAPVPHLLVFGSLDEDPDYARELLSHVRDLDVQDDVVFLDGVPLSSHKDAAGHWRLDEVDLLRLCRASNGAVLFTPSTRGVESVGLGPALAAIAEVPCAISDYACFEDIYGGSSNCVKIEGEEGMMEAAVEVLDLMAKQASGDLAVQEALRSQKQQVTASFDPEPWRLLIREMAEAVASRRQLPTSQNKKRQEHMDGLRLSVGQGDTSGHRAVDTHGESQTAMLGDPR